MTRHDRAFIVMSIYTAALLVATGSKGLLIGATAVWVVLHLIAEFGHR